MKSQNSNSLSPVSVNKKIRNATKTTVDGIKFDSKLESYFYGRLKQLKVNFVMQKVYELQPKFRYWDENIRNIEIRVDFYLPDYDAIIDTKGFATPENKIKIKMLKYLLENDEFQRDGRATAIHLPSNQKECDNILTKYLKL